jgi:hypothetical protein
MSGVRPHPAGGVRTVSALIDWMIDRGLEPADVLVDITGGTKLMSVCAFLAAEHFTTISQRG